jgi:hypothetical protein
LKLCKDPADLFLIMPTSADIFWRICPGQTGDSGSSGSRADAIMAVRVSADADGELAGRAAIRFEAQAFMAGQLPDHVFFE